MTGLLEKRAKFAFLGALCCGLAIGVAACATGGNSSSGHVETSAAARGLSYAREACSSCHAVEVGQGVSPNAAAPSFEALSNRSDMSRAALGALLRSPHGNMPNLIVKPERIDDLAAYLYALGEDE